MATAFSPAFTRALPPSLAGAFSAALAGFLADFLAAGFAAFFAFLGAGVKRNQTADMGGRVIFAEQGCSRKGVSSEAISGALWMPEPPYFTSSEFMSSLSTPGLGRPMVKSS